MHVAPGQQLFYYGSRVWPDNVRKAMYDQFGGMPKDLSAAHDYDPKVGSLCAHETRARHCSSAFVGSRGMRASASCTRSTFVGLISCSAGMVRVH